MLGLPLKLAIEVPSELVEEEGSVLCPPRWEVYEEFVVVVVVDLEMEPSSVRR